MGAPENPPAFPACNEANVNGTMGMSLRDWFAGQAPPAPDNFTITPPECDNWQDSEKSSRVWSDWHVRRAVAWATTYADAMLAERERGGDA